MAYRYFTALPLDDFAMENLAAVKEFGTRSIRAIVLVDHPVYFEPSREFARERTQNLQMNREEWTRNFVKEMHHTPPSKKYIDTLTRDVLSTPTNAAALMIANTYFIGPTDLRPALNSLERPALFIYSSLDWAVEAANEVRQGWPDVPVEIFDSTSHALFVDKPGQFNRGLEKFLDSLPE